jgi:hypothetical protein
LRRGPGGRKAISAAAERDQVPLLRRAPRRGEIDDLAQRAGVVVVEVRRGPGDAAELWDIERLEVERIAEERRAARIGRDPLHAEGRPTIGAPCSSSAGVRSPGSLRAVTGIGGRSATCTWRVASV